jgi:hypothetical protein
MLYSWTMVSEIIRDIVDQKTYDVLAIAVGCTFALFRSNLHEPLLTGTANGIRVAKAFLHRERCEQNRGDYIPVINRVHARPHIKENTNCLVRVHTS